MLGGAYLCYEGAEKVYEAVMPHQAHAHEARLGTVALNPQTLEDEKVAGAIKTDFILSAEIMAITLAAHSRGRACWTRPSCWRWSAIGITVAVYGAVALIVKADDVGVALATNRQASAIGALRRALGRAPGARHAVLPEMLGVVGTAAMIWVGGGIMVHGLETYGAAWLGHAIHAAAVVAAHALPALAAAVEWVVSAAVLGRRRPADRRGADPGGGVRRGAGMGGAETGVAGARAAV